LVSFNEQIRKNLGYILLFLKQNTISGVFQFSSTSRVKWYKK